MKIVKRFLPLILAVVLVFGSCLSVSASSLSTIKDVAISTMNSEECHYGNIYYNYYTVFYYNGEYIYIFSNNPFVVNKSGNDYVYYVSTMTYWMDYYSETGFNPVFDGSYHNIDGYTYMQYPIDSLILTNYNVCDKNSGAVVFPHPLPNPVKAVEALPEMIIPQTKMIATIAVSFLALLMGLVMLRKKLPIFLRS